MQWTGIPRVIFGLVLLLGVGIGVARAQSPSSDEFRILFPHFAAGNGFSTVFTFMNSGLISLPGPAQW